MRHRTIAGTILYTSKKPERLDQPRGIEHFRFTRHGDGKVTLRAYCEIEDPAPTVMRDVTYAIDEHGQPMDCSVRLTVGDEFVGSGWFRFTPDLRGVRVLRSRHRPAVAAGSHRPPPRRLRHPSGGRRRLPAVAPRLDGGSSAQAQRHASVARPSRRHAAHDRRLRHPRALCRPGDGDGEGGNLCRPPLPVHRRRHGRLQRPAPPTTTSGSPTTKTPSCFRAASAAIC